jgi:hypothetical protein
MVVTERDLRILEWVHECRFLSREQIQRLEFGPRAASSCKRRLTLLFHNGYVGRLFLPLPNAYGASKAVYHLDQAGARLLARAQRRELDHVEWRRRQSETGQLFLAHNIDSNDVRVAFTRACRRRKLQLEWLDERALRRLDVRHRLRGPASTATILPDAYFTISDGDAVDGFALEVDRGTVPERRMRLRMRAYGEWASSGAYRRHLPAVSLRVVFAITHCGRDDQRLAHLKRWCEEENGGTLFWFVGRDGLEVEEVLDAPVWWVSGKAEPLKLALSSDPF